MLGESERAYAEVPTSKGTMTSADEGSGALHINCLMESVFTVGISSMFIQHLLNKYY